MTVTEIMKQVQALNPQDRQELVKLLVDSLDVGKPEPPEPKNIGDRPSIASWTRWI